MKKTAAITLILVCLMVLGLVCVRPVKAQYQGDIVINSDGRVSPPTAPMQQTGNTYVLTNDMNGSITVQRNNTVLNGNGHTLISGGLMGWSRLILCHQHKSFAKCNCEKLYNNVLARLLL